jgi:hypothetical protein
VPAQRAQRVLSALDCACSDAERTLEGSARGGQAYRRAGSQRHALAYSGGPARSARGAPPSMACAGGHMCRLAPLAPRHADSDMSPAAAIWPPPPHKAFRHAGSQGHALAYSGGPACTTRAARWPRFGRTPLARTLDALWRGGLRLRGADTRRSGVPRHLISAGGVDGTRRLRRSLFFYLSLPLAACWEKLQPQSADIRRNAIARPLQHGPRAHPP